MNKLEIFKNQDFGEIRAISINDEPYFVGKDVAMILGYINPRKAVIDHVDDDDKKDGVTIRDSIGREQKPAWVKERGVYGAIISSKNKHTKKFKL